MDSTADTASLPTREAGVGLRESAGAVADHRLGERRRQSRFVLRERRSGYDRRRGAGGRTLIPACVHEWCHTYPWFLPLILVAANLLSLADIALTLRVLETGAVEANPLLKVLLDIDVHLAAGVKAALVAAASLLIWRYRWHRRILPLALFVLAVFAAVVVYQGMILLAV
jgi:hypothetical protein